jgi:hypothetical protein
MLSDKVRYTIVAVIVAGALGCLGGQGSTDGGSGKDPGYRDGVYTGQGTGGGSLSLNIESTSIPVGGTSGFSVKVRDASDQPVPDTTVVCDSEQGIAIIEPSKGYELTGASGAMSGVIGCAAPGSYQMVCRLNIGDNRRQFAGVRCTGDIPSGFNGFPGAAGGGLGGGTQTTTQGDLTILQAGFQDSGNLASGISPNTSIDTVQGADCDRDPTTNDPEPFYDTYVNLSVRNDRAERVSFSYLTYSISDVDGAGTSFDSADIAVSTSLESNGDTGNIIVPVFKAYNGFKYVGNPTGVGYKITASGLRTVVITLVGETSSGEVVSASVNVTASFGNFTAAGCK